VIAETFERIHRSNLVGIDILPLEFMRGESARTLGLTGREQFSILRLGENLSPGAKLTVTAQLEDGFTREFETLARIDTPLELEYYRHGGVLPYVLRQRLGASSRTRCGATT